MPTPELVTVATINNNDDGSLEKKATNDTLDNGTVYSITSEENRRVVRKIDLYLLPFMMFTQMLQNVDATSLSYASVWGLQKDLHIDTSQYTWIASILFFGYLLFEWPMGFVAQHWHTGKVVGTVVILWGLCMMATALCSNFGGLLAQRFFLGALQSVLTPAWVLLSSIFYLREEQTFRIVFWWSMNGVSLGVGGLLSYGCGFIRVDNIPSWKWIYIIEGAITVVWGFAVWYYVPTSPATARWLTPEERGLAVKRLVTNKTGTKNATIKKYQIIEALDPRKDPQGWLIFWLIFFNEFVNGGFGVFFAININALGFSDLETSLLGLAIGGAQVFWMVGAAVFTLRYKNVRIVMAILALLPAFIGFLLQIALPDGTHRTAKIIGVCLSLGYTATCAISFQLPAQNAGGFTKRTTITSMAFLGYSAGNIIGPHAFYDGQTPRFLTGYIIDLCCFVIQAILLLILLWWYKRENRKRNEQYDPPSVEEGDEVTDLTDRECMSFRYTY